MQPPDEGLDECKSKVLGAVFLLIGIEVQLAFEKRVKELEDRVGRDLAPLRGQLAQLFANSPLALGPAEPPEAVPTPEAAAARRRGRPPKAASEVPGLNDIE